MGIQVNFSSASKRLNSTKQVTMSESYDCTFKNGCDMLNPTLLLELNLESFPSYTEFQIGNKYYHVQTIRSVREHLFEVDGHIDVLATYKNAIGATTEYIVRAASAYNLDVIDTKYPTLGVSHITEQSFSTLHSSFTNGGYFVIGVVGGSTAESAGVTYYALNNVTMVRFLTFMYGTGWLNATDVSVDLQKQLVNPIQYIDSIKWYPFDIGNSSLISLTPDDIKFGFWDTQIRANVIDAEDSIMPYAQSITIPNHGQYSRGHYLNGSPYTRLSLQCYSFGQIPVDPSLFVADGTLTLSIAVDVITGLGRLTLRCGSNPKPFYTKFGQVGVDCKVGQINTNFLDAIGSVADSAMQIHSGKPIGTASGIISGVNSLMPQLASNGSNGSKMAFNIEPKLSIIRQNLVDEDLPQLGRPLCSPRVINTLSGYVQCENVDIDIACTESEKNEIINFMESGFFYE